MKRKIFVLDTNVLLHDPNSLLTFVNNDVVIPVIVLEELNKKKKLSTELGKNARAALRFLDSLKNTGSGNLHEGLKTQNGISIKIQFDIKGNNIPLPQNSNNNKIITTAYFLKEQQKQTVVFVSKDLVSRVKAELLGIEAEEYESMRFSYNKMHSGLRELDVNKKTIDSFYKDSIAYIDINDFFANEYCLLKAAEDSSALCKFDQHKKCLVPLLKQSQNIWGIGPLNIKQKCAIDLLLHDDIKLVTLVGPAGTGKTLLALACGLKKTLDEGVYTKIIISRPIIPLGQDIGYLPGTKEEKLLHWMQPIYDNLEFLCTSSTNGDHNADVINETMQWIINSKKIEMEAMTYIRGRTLPRVYIIIDEAQNLTPHEVKTIISRAGEGTKVILAGDPSQIDNPYLDKDSNGLTLTIGKFRNHSIFGHMVLDKTERSELAALAANIM